MLEPETQSTERSVRRSQSRISYAAVPGLAERTGDTNACSVASAYVGTFRAEGYTVPSPFRVRTPIAPASGRSAATLRSPPNVPAETRASGFSRNTHGVALARMPTFAAEPKPALRR